MALFKPSEEDKDALGLLNELFGGGGVVGSAALHMILAKMELSATSRSSYYKQPTLDLPEVGDIDVALSNPSMTTENIRMVIETMFLMKLGISVTVSSTGQGRYEGMNIARRFVVNRPEGKSIDLLFIPGENRDNRADLRWAEHVPFELMKTCLVALDFRGLTVRRMKVSALKDLIGKDMVQDPYNPKGSAEQVSKVVQRCKIIKKYLDSLGY